MAEPHRHVRPPYFVPRRAPRPPDGWVEPSLEAE